MCALRHFEPDDDVYHAFIFLDLSDDLLVSDCKVL